VVGQLQPAANYTFLIALVVWAVFFGILCGYIWRSRGGTFGTGLLMGAILGIFGLIIAVAARPTPRPEAATRECPWCKEAMRRDAIVCPHCQRESDPWRLEGGVWFSRDPEGREVWYEDARRRWNRYRRDEQCPYCGHPMPAHMAVCRNCKGMSNAIRHSA
jgi:hypothetical protein